MKISIEKPKGNDDPQDDLLDQVKSFAKDHDITSDELNVAYKIALGFKPEEAAREKESREEVYDLAKNMDSLMRDGLAANRIVELIRTRNEYESMSDNYHLLVDAMQIGEKEKRLLHSIVDRKSLHSGPKLN